MLTTDIAQARHEMHAAAQDLRRAKDRYDKAVEACLRLSGEQKALAEKRSEIEKRNRAVVKVKKE